MKTTVKSFLVVFIGAFSLVIAGGIGTGYAAVVGVCADCHTMHQTDGSLATVAQYGALTTNSCAGCHSTTLTDPLENTGNKTPYVVGTGLDATHSLAGGFFSSETDAADNHTNAMHSLGSTSPPVGYSGSFYTGGTDGLTCAGSAGCHGVETTTIPAVAVGGGHHENDLKNSGLMQSGYRMLVVGSAPVGGTECTDYEEALIAAGGTGTGSVYNTYGASTDGVATDTVSALCGKCHGNFHARGSSGTGAVDAWIRHPTDVEIPGGWTIGDELNALTDADNYNNPVGLAGAVRCATCLSCHRAHGTANNDLLRWAYSTQNAGSATTYGCLGCHNKQR